ncbi:NAD(P)H-quinone oxidoreductase [Acidiphilium acidophilum]|uniref:NAD(P)H-quinone oxidoreductase n=1 Tax=Acidiphilium acidophilum TaxID=76588 RepID=A0AAW9DS75_ACIAO|nr:NAD(P)H-quinone oxidoreductase [Acidiphilium acidophilum]MDX5932021.1 NAD(P)H-quinone oxidoreductase [Acidiphilium acidophilum]
MSIPAEMRHITFNQPGGPDVLYLTTGPVPSLQSDEILIKVAAAGVNRPDIQQRKGAYPPPPGASPILGLEVAGEVVACGPGVTTWNRGDHVTALCNGGGYAEFVAVPAGQCLPWPAGFDAVQAASLPETFFTVWANLFQLGRLAPGETVLVHGGTSGIGVTAIQLGVAFGAEMYATAGSGAKCAACLELGATGAINYREADFLSDIKEMTQGAGVDVILDMVGAPYAQRNLSALKRDGRLVQIAFMQGNVAQEFDLLPIMIKRLTVTGSTMRPRTAAEKAAIATQLHETVWPWLEAGRVRPVIAETASWESVSKMHQVMENSSHVGKIILKIS